jgi:hypothetical protein
LSSGEETRRRRGAGKKTIAPPPSGSRPGARQPGCLRPFRAAGNRRRYHLHSPNELENGSKNRKSDRQSESATVTRSSGEDADAETSAGKSRGKLVARESGAESGKESKFQQAQSSDPFPFTFLVLQLCSVSDDCRRRSDRRRTHHFSFLPPLSLSTSFSPPSQLPRWCSFPSVCSRDDLSSSRLSLPVVALPHLLGRRKPVICRRIVKDKTSGVCERFPQAKAVVRALESEKSVG